MSVRIIIQNLNNGSRLIGPTGVHSARKTTAEEAQAVWSMAFEYLRPAKLKREHAKLVETLFPS